MTAETVMLILVVIAALGFDFTNGFHDTANALRMIAAWLIALPAAAAVGALMWWIGDLIGGLGGAVAIFVILCALAVAMWLRSRVAPVDHNNVNDEWTEPAREKVAA